MPYKSTQTLASLWGVIRPGEIISDAVPLPVQRAWAEAGVAVAVGKPEPDPIESADVTPPETAVSRRGSSGSRTRKG